ncbi:thiamine-phosphate pyrophosphorylase [Aphanomyces astaci]|uniref:Thiamine-phosphate pyrophosphorylase n=2 Tax=Aphanomyces astaci TaxID=112090 RepID=W4HDE6_APHAT|nr:thiamine-phosphate pyrophosphorylase [Aphanomyces astaci]ETV89148.1 thiamine-phosphate pyrophosphorylase [Aphanomyces astaci]|eukprot:XP_009821548.1 thiamine-phosphate pyrophosphorylase [Aphanomyces astaci]
MAVLQHNQRPWLVLVVSAHDVLVGTALKAALSVPAVDVVQLRHSSTQPSPNSTSEFADAMRALPSMGKLLATPPLYVVNAPPDLPQNTPCLDGRHYPERYLATLKERQQQWDGRGFFGVSVHAISSAVTAAALESSYLQVGTMFPTASHPEKTSVEGPELMRAVRQALPSTRLIGIGGITESNCVDVMRAGANGIAVIRAILDADKPDIAATRLRQALDNASVQDPSVNVI